MALSVGSEKTQLTTNADGSNSKHRIAPSLCDIRNLILSTLLLHFLTILIAFSLSFLPLFDASPSLAIDAPDPSFRSRFISIVLRWDAFHYLQVAQEGYRYEHQYAWMPGLPILLRILSMLGVPLSLSSSAMDSSIMPYFIFSTLVSLDTTRLLYLLTLRHTKSRQLALLSGYLSLLPSSPPTLHLAPYTEPCFTWASYKGMLYCAQRQWFKAALAFLFAGCFRSHAFMLGGFIFWGMIIDDWLDGKRFNPLKLAWASILSLFPIMPFLFHQYNGYRMFCINTSHPRPWCSNRLPSIYTYVQSFYWNNGFMRYWTPQQIPNFVISAPVILLLLWGSLTTIPNILSSIFLEGRPYQQRTPFHSRAFLPHAIYALLYTLMLLFFAHTQIILRQACSIPYLYWSAARLFSDKPAYSRTWVTWSIMWGLTSIVLWTVFLPPA